MLSLAITDLSELDIDNAVTVEEELLVKLNSSNSKVHRHL